jgi:pimeloyl-ACP methyl ester carboxylesterase
VLIAHGPDGDRAQVSALAEGLRKKGFAVLAADLRGHGQSPAGKPWTELDRAERERMWTFALRDLGAAAAFLRGRRDIHTTNLTLVGVGGSAALALRHAAGDENARAVVLIAPSEDQLGFDLPDEMQRCGGLPTLVLASRDGRAMAKRLVDGVQSTGVPGLELAVLRSGAADYLSDSKMPDRVAAFLRQVVVERKGR